MTAKHLPFSSSHTNNLLRLPPYRPPAVFPSPSRRSQGIGPEIAESVKAIFTKAKVPIKWEEVDVTPTLVDGVSTIPADSLASIRKNTIALKGPLATPSAFSPFLPTSRGECSSTADAASLPALLCRRRHLEEY